MQWGVSPAKAKIVATEMVTITFNTHWVSLDFVLSGSFAIAAGVNLAVVNLSLITKTIHLSSNLIPIKLEYWAD